MIGVAMVCVAAAAAVGVPPSGDLAGSRLSRGARDLQALGSWRTAAIVATGGAAAGVAAALGDGEGAVGPLQRSDLDGLVDAGNVYGNGVFIGGGILAVLGTGAVFDRPGLRDLGWDLGESFAVTGVATTLIKVSVNRTRPDGGHLSFPSGHTASAACLVPVLWRDVGWQAGVPSAIATVIVGAGRLEDRRHWLSDILFGAGLGVAVGEAVTRDEGEKRGVAVQLGGSSLALVTRF